MRIAVVEDDPDTRKVIIRYLERFQSETGTHSEIDGFSDGKDIVNGFRPLYDLIFLDIEMREMDGIQAAREIRKTDRKVILVFLTNIARYAIKGYEVGAADYILKPLSYELFRMKMLEFEKLIRWNADRSVVITAKDKMYKVFVNQILYVEVMNHRVIYHMDGQEDIELWGSLKSAEQILAGMGFAKCNSCYLVNLRHVQAIHENVVVAGGRELQISRPRKKAFVQAVADSVGGI
ncbi:MAG: LytTR family DNA-binding domain-containing protein [Clostridiales bacterium]|nr:LytTR family DNA-binding domain-containing protein [Clostridiales bacterium]